MTPVKIGAGKFDGHRGGEGRSCHREKPVKPIRKSQGTGQSKWWWQCSLSGPSPHPLALSLPEEEGISAQGRG